MPLEMPFEPAQPEFIEAQLKQREQMLEQKAARYAELHPGDDEPVKKPGIVHRLIERLRGRS
jgi:hypothetical protein